MKQKIIKIGNSQGVILPKEALEAAGIKPGSEVYITPQSDSGVLLLSDKKPDENYARTAKFNSSAQKIMSDYKEAWKNLAHLDEK